MKFFNTMTRRLEEFKPINPSEVKMYTCGPTVYDYAHIGNFRTYAFEDLLRRYLKYKGYKVTQVMNITDVDDKIIKASRQNKIPAAEYSKIFTQSFFEDIKELNLEPAEIYPRATEHIPEMVQLIKTLIAKGIAYQGEDGSYYFSIAKFPAYGRLAHLEAQDLKIGARIKHDEYDKLSASDFALWKAWDEADGEVFWETELGKGRPGWHIECSAMSMKYLGESFDIHTGGVDNIFPHHENEIAQSEAATGKTFVRYWMHSEHLRVENQKMSKSLGNFYTLRSLKEKGFNPLTLRYVYISQHYRSKLNFTLEGLQAAQKTLEGLYDFIRRLKRLPEGSPNPVVEQLIASAHREFIQAMDEDLNTPVALAAVFTLITKVNTLMAKDSVSAADGAAILELLLDLDKILGLKLAGASAVEELPAEIMALIQEREQVRKAKDFKASDLLRDELKSKGYLIEDTPGGPRWKKI
jgi:cysteinyl-tRNA synthetase